MRKPYIFVISLLVSIAFVGQAQNKYTVTGPFPDTLVNKIPAQVVNVGIAVDPEGKVWVQSYTNVTPPDTIQRAGLDTYVNVRPVYVYNPDGTQAAFSPIRILTGVDQNGAAVTDTLIERLGYGGAKNPSNGNIVFTWGSRAAAPGALIWEIDYKTGAGVRRILSPPGLTTNSPASIGVNNDGEYFTSAVLGNLPVQILNADFSAGTQVTAALPAIGRAMTVSGDGNSVYLPRFTAVPPMVYIYSSANGSLGPYALSDSIMLGGSIESIAIHPVTGHVWMMTDRRSIWEGPNTTRAWGANNGYAYNPVSKAIVDSFHVDEWPVTSTGPLPRGMAFSPTGDTLYLSKFDAATLPAVVRAIYGPATGVKKVDDMIPEGFTLAQNYPNPFNPTTEIEFTISREGMTTLRIYDMLGREVATLLNEHMPVGTFKATFNASSLTSGTYVYEVVSGNVRMTKRMMLVK